MNEFEVVFEEFRQHILDSSTQNWLLGAGISYDANIPLMYPLTTRINEIISDADCQDDKDIVTALKDELVEGCHVEHYLSHLGDLIALASRSRESNAILSGQNYSSEKLNSCYRAIIKAIGDTVRYGYKDSDNIGTPNKHIVEIKGHLEFIQALFVNRADLERRSKIRFFTTNYDTLLEDALALNKKRVVDGFTGGAVGFWNPEYEFANGDGFNSCSLYKLHGSIDWHKDPNFGVVRVRYGSKYFSDTSDIMIYPQATKYVETQKDPFSSLFHHLRDALNNPNQNVFISCGYSFNDAHINSEIELALSSKDNKSTFIAFTDERPSGDIKVNETLDRWLNNSVFGERVYVAGKNGIYHNSLEPVSPEPSKEFNWWTFSGMTEFLKAGTYEE
jgi:hypothetical protein